jgi:hypothetical protein
LVEFKLLKKVTPNLVKIQSRIDHERQVEVFMTLKENFVRAKKLEACFMRRK